jgi:hypothetical protein
MEELLGPRRRQELASPSSSPTAPFHQSPAADAADLRVRDGAAPEMRLAAPPISPLQISPLFAGELADAYEGADTRLVV